MFGDAEEGKRQVSENTVGKSRSLFRPDLPESGTLTSIH